jgi:hypothetical protein
LVALVQKRRGFHQAARRKRSNGGNWQLVVRARRGREREARYNRLALAAIAACRAFNAKLVIAKLDRLSRDAHFLLGLEKAGIEFVAVDMQHANRLTVGIAKCASLRRAAAAGARRAGRPLGQCRGTRTRSPRLRHSTWRQVDSGRSYQRAGSARVEWLGH